MAARSDDNISSVSMVIVTEPMDSVVHSMLTSCQEIQEERLIFNIGGTHFQTSKVVMRADPTSLFSLMLLPKSPFRPNSTYFFDRDPAHFRIILNYLRNGAHIEIAVLPKEQRYLYEILQEAKYYKLLGLQTLCVRDCTRSMPSSCHLIGRIKIVSVNTFVVVLGNPAKCC
jgi:hypothetical protein